MDLLDGLLKMGSALVIVLALVALAAAGGRRWLVPALAGGARQPIRLAGSLALGGRRSILVVEVGDRTLVVGASAQNLILLAQFEKEGAASGAHVNVVGVGFTPTHPSPLEGEGKGGGAR